MSGRMRTVLFLVINFLLVVLIIFSDELFDWGRQKNKPSQKSLQPLGLRQRKLKSILLWVSPERLEVSIFGTGHDAFLKNGCKVSDCEIVNYQKYRPMDSFDAVIFNLNDQYLFDTLPPFDFNNNRRRNQRFIFLTQEPPESLKKYDVAVFLQDFNWTMSYRLDSDIRFLYGRIHPKPELFPSPTYSKSHKDDIFFKKNKNLVTKSRNTIKSKLVAWMVSHCVTSGGREEYVRELSRYITVDTFGNCGNKTCDWRNPSKCYKMIEANYKFYLSFENSLCHDYVTEKFFLIMKYRVVPIVFGGANYSQIAPPHSYIDARKYTPKKLAMYLKKLAADDTLYNEYLKWKKDYIVEAGIEQMARHGFCDLCQKLHHDHEEKSYSSELVTQWHYRAQCQ